MATPCTFLQPASKRPKPSLQPNRADATHNSLDLFADYDETNGMMSENFVGVSGILHQSHNNEDSNGQAREQSQQILDASLSWMSNTNRNLVSQRGIYPAPGGFAQNIQGEPTAASGELNQPISWSQSAYDSNIAEEELGIYLGDYIQSEEFEETPRQTYFHDIPPDEEESTSVQSLDQLEGLSAQYFGLSGESDPYLLRHFRWDENGQRPFVRVHFRRVGPESRATGVNSQSSRRAPEVMGSSGSRDAEKKNIPIHFALAKDELAKEAKLETATPSSLLSESARDELNRLIHPEDGRRMVAL